MNLKEKIYSCLHKASPALKLLNDDYFIIGTSALVLSGIPIETTYDIDILTSKEDANSLKEKWKSRIITEYVTQRDDLFRSNFGRYNFELLDIEVMGYLEVNKNGIWQALAIQEFSIIKIDDIEIKLPTIEEQKRIYRFFGREKDFEKIRLIETLE